MELHTFDSETQKSIEKCWEEIGIQLEVDYAILTRIRETRCTKGYVPSYSYHLAFRDMILVWLKQKSTKKTWLYFVEALEHLKKFPEFAKHLRRKYCTYITSLYDCTKLNVPST